jgi:hypothetical protein
MLSLGYVYKLYLFNSQVNCVLFTFIINLAFHSLPIAYVLSLFVIFLFT